MGSPSWTIASIRAWPKAPRVCLLARMCCSPTTWLESSVMFFCARVDHGKALVEFDRPSWVLRGRFGHRLADAVTEAVQPLGKAAHQLRLP